MVNVYMLFASMMLMFGIGVLVGVVIFLKTKILGEITIDEEHYKSPSTLFTLYGSTQAAFKHKYVLFKIKQGDLREKFGSDIDMSKED